MRGTKAKREDEWRRGQYHDGRLAGKAGAQGMYADQFYQRGYRDGVKARQEAERPKCGHIYVHASGYREVCTRDPIKECPVIGHGDWRRAPKEVSA